MLTSLDGKIMGEYMQTPQGEVSGTVFNSIAFGKNPHYKHQGWLSGRITTDDNFTFYKKPNLDESALPVPEGDYLAPSNSTMYYVSIDPKGVLGWQSNIVDYEQANAHVIEVLTNQASNAYKAFLRKMGISYILVGDKEIDYELTLSKLKELFHIDMLMLGGGGVLNWSFIQRGLCDELSLVIAAAADGDPATPALFSAKEGLSSVEGIGFELKDVKVMEGSTVWLTYKVLNKN